MSRRLAPDEQALWALVAATVTPLHPERNPLPPSGELPGSQPKARPVPDPLPETAKPVSQPPVRTGVGPRRAAAVPPPPTAVRQPRASPETLDSSWDRHISSGRIVPDIVIDLHGLRRDAARQLLYRRVVDACDRGLRVILVITGKGDNPGPSPADLMPGNPNEGRHGSAPIRGAIRADLPRWLGEEGLSTRIAAVRRAHPRHGGAGAAYLVLKRRRG